MNKVNRIFYEISYFLIVKDPLVAWATVVQREPSQLQNGIVFVQFQDDKASTLEMPPTWLLSDQFNDIIILETSTFFLAYQPVLKSLQTTTKY